MATNTQSASTGNLGSIQNTIIAQMRYTAEHNMPVVGLIEQFTLGKGEKQLDIPKAGQVDAQDLVDGIDLTDSEDINASIAHAKMLAKQKIISWKESQKIVSGLKKIKVEFEKGTFNLDPLLEDIHMNICLLYTSPSPRD